MFHSTYAAPQFLYKEEIFSLFYNFSRSSVQKEPLAKTVNTTQSFPDKIVVIITKQMEVESLNECNIDQ